MFQPVSGYTVRPYEPDLRSMCLVFLNECALLCIKIILKVYTADLGTGFVELDLVDKMMSSSNKIEIFSG